MTANLVHTSAMFSSKCQLSCSSANLASEPSPVLRPLSTSTLGQRVTSRRRSFYVSDKRIQTHSFVRNAYFIFSLGQYQKHDSCSKSAASPCSAFVCFRTASPFPRQVKQTHSWHNEWN